MQVLSDACQVRRQAKHFSDWSCVNTWNGKVQYHAGQETAYNGACLSAQKEL